MKSPVEVLDYWFGPKHESQQPQDRSDLWWKKNPDVDADIRNHFLSTLEASAEGKLSHWKESPDGRLAHIILVDQMSRNMHRGTALMYAQDDLGQELALLSAISDHRYSAYHERMFQYMPLMHAENVALQRLCTHLFEQEMTLAHTDEVRKAAQNNHDYAIRHQVIVERFGRFPHRNVILGRTSSAEEQEFLRQPGSSF